MEAHRAADAYFAVFLRRTVGSLRAGGGVGGQLDGGAVHFALLPQEDNGVVFQCVDAYGAVQRHGGGRVLVRLALGAHRVREGAGLFYFFRFLRVFAFVVLFRLGGLVFAHAGGGVQRYRAALDLGRLRPVVAVQEDGGVVLHIADENGRADFHVGVGLAVLHRKAEAVLLFGGGLHDGLGVHVDSAVGRLRLVYRRSRNGGVFPNRDIGVVCVGNNADGSAEAKGGILLVVVAAVVGAVHFVLDVLGAAFAVRARSVFGLFVVLGIHILGGVFDRIGWVDGLFLALFLVLGFPRVAFVLLIRRVFVVLRLFRIACLRGAFPRVAARSLLRLVVHRHFQPVDPVLRLDIHGARRDGAVDDRIGARVVVGHAHVGDDIARSPHDVGLDIDVALRGRFDGNFALRRREGRRVRRGIHRHFRLGVARQNRHAHRHGIPVAAVACGGKGGFRVRVGGNFDAVAGFRIRARGCQVAVDHDVRVVVDAGNRHGGYHFGSARHRFAFAVLFALARGYGDGLLEIQRGGRGTLASGACNGALFPDVDGGFVLLAGIVDKEVLVRSGFLARQFLDRPIKEGFVFP